MAPGAAARAASCFSILSGRQAGGLDAEVAGGGGALILLLDEADAVAVGLDDAGGAVPGAVVYDKDFVDGRGLGEDTVDGAVDEALCIVGRDNDGDGHLQGIIALRGGRFTRKGGGARFASGE
jgi:hypothetical protein